METANHLPAKQWHVILSQIFYWQNLQYFPTESVPKDQIYLRIDITIGRRLYSDWYPYIGGEPIP